MPLRAFLLSLLLLLAGAASAAAADSTFMGHSVYGYSGYSQGGALYINAFPHFAEVSLDGRPIGVANDLQAALVDARVGVHRLTVTAPGYEPTTVLVRVVRDWTTRVRLHLIPAY
jgi:expansin (peptidoglycan-binding protein)